jgi:hypothetical protein
MAVQEPEDTAAIDLAEDVEDSLVCAQARLGGLPGVCSEEAFELMQELGLLGPGGTLTRRGVERARAAQVEYFGEVQPTRKA